MTKPARGWSGYWLSRFGYVGGPQFPSRHVIADRWSRAGRAIGYALIALAGGFILFLDIFGPYYKTMGAWCLVGGAFCFVGAATDRWGGEYVGLPLVGSAMVAFSVLTVRDTWALARWVAAPSILILFAIGVLFAARWADVASVARSAREYADAARHR